MMHQARMKLGKGAGLLYKKYNTSNLTPTCNQIEALPRKDQIIFRSSKQTGDQICRNVTTKAYLREGKDKHGRTLRRRVIRPSSQKNRASNESQRSILARLKKLPKLPPAGQAIMPKPLKSPPPNPLPQRMNPNASSIITTASSSSSSPTVVIHSKGGPEKFYKWLLENAGTIVLNIGSVCTLLAYTRSDILELRYLSITGSISSIIYFSSRPAPRPYAPMLWSGIFVMTNAYMVYHILQERRGKIQVALSREEEMLYHEHFLPHGVTPRQFGRLVEKAKRVELKEGQVLLAQGESLQSVYLVIDGATQGIGGGITSISANNNNKTKTVRRNGDKVVISRRITAASSSPGNRNTLAGGDSGAWIGELEFLEVMAARQLEREEDWRRYQKQVQEEIYGDDSNEHATSSSSLSSQQYNMKKKNSGRRRIDYKSAMLTYIATKDSTLLQWTHDDLAEIMNSSVDMRSSMTRAMTAAIAGKVLNLVYSRVSSDNINDQKPLWLRWMADHRNYSEKVQIEKQSAVSTRITTDTSSTMNKANNNEQRDGVNEIKLIEAK